MTSIIQLRIKRGHSFEFSQEDKDKIIECGEPIFVIDKNYLVVGNGETKFSELKPINGVITSDDGRLYTLNIDKNGKPYNIRKLIVSQEQRGKFELSI